MITHNFIMLLIIILGITTVEAISWSYTVFNQCKWIKNNNFNDRRNISYGTIGFFSLCSSFVSLGWWIAAVYFSTLHIAAIEFTSTLFFVTFSFQILTIHMWFMIASIISIPFEHLPILSKFIIKILSKISFGKYFKYTPIEERTNLFEYNGRSLVNNFFDVIPDMIWVKDIDNKIIYANNAACKTMFASPVEDVLGKTSIEVGEFIRKKGIEYTFGNLCDGSDEETKKSSIPKLFFEYGSVDGKYLAVKVIKSPFYSVSGNLEGTIGMGTDVTIQSEIYNDLEQHFRSGRIETGISIFFAHKQKFTAMNDVELPNYKYGAVT